MTTETSPFHAGEREIQSRFGVREKMEQVGRKVIRPYMIEQHRVFYSQLPTFFIGWQDPAGYPWATVLTGAPGFLSTPDETTLRIEALPDAADPLRAHLQAGTAIGGLGLEFETRRRNRLNGSVQDVTETGFSIAVEQSFGNCPQFIQTRSLSGEAAVSAISVDAFDSLEARDIELISRSDTLFIASVAGPSLRETAVGADVSHRGGNPGFVCVTRDGTLEFPDYAGNRQFQTLGNIQVTGKAGLLFIDFETGDLLRLSGEAEIIWEGPEVDALPGAERIVRIRPIKGIRIEGGMPLHWQFEQYSPHLAHLGP